MNFEDIYKNKLIKKIISDNQIILTKKSEIDPKTKKKKKTRSSSREKFIIESFRLMHEILLKIEVLNYFPVFLNSYPKRPLWEKTFSHSDYLKYHTEIYLSNVVGILDRCLLFVNLIYNLGLKENFVKYELIISNKHIIGETVKKVLKLINEFLEKTNIKLLRNITQHRVRFSNEKLDEISTDELILRSAPKLNPKERYVFNLVVKMNLRSYIGEKKKEAKEINGHVVKLCDGFFLSLFKKYEERLEAF